ncbi:MAG: dihydrolipoyl dehydrogenase [Acidimicrobiia bacterium]|nr:dihydrolipoyl dehydrogenase [Acidimicrobiia bacterium]
MADKHDVVIIGGGPGGYAAALYGASAGLDVALVEKAKVGGTCLHVGCVPAKELLETAAVYRTVSGAKEFGINAGAPTVEWAVTLERKGRIVDQLANGLRSLLRGRKVTIAEGVGRLSGKGSVTVAGGDGAETTLEGDHVILAAGSVPRTLPGFDVDGKLVVTSDELLSMADLPGSAAVIGGGAIGCEFASMLSDLGVQVTILEALPRILAGVDKDVGDVIARSFKKRGIATHTGVKVSGHTPEPDGNSTTVQFGEGQSVTVDLVVMSVGRRPFADQLDLDGSGVTLDERGFVEVDGRCRTAAEGVWAVGDLIATPALAHVGFAEAVVAVRDILGEGPVPVDYDRVPWCIYSHPEVSFVGYSEEQAKEKGFEVVTSKHRPAGNSRAMILGETEGLVKVIAERKSDGTGGRVLGVHMAGPWVTEQLGQGYLAVNWEANVDEVAQFLQPHPTLSELFGETMLSLTGRSLH